LLLVEEKSDSGWRRVAAVILEGCMQAPDSDGMGMNQDRTFKS
jgi:hypothetical protein